jgi:hypothetical protein
VGLSGIAALVLRWSQCASVKAEDCYHMRKLYLLNRMPYLLEAEYDLALLRVSLRLWPQNNDCEWMRGTRPKEMRVFSIRAAAVADGAEACCLSNAQVFAEIGSVGGRESRPAVSC